MNVHIDITHPAHVHFFRPVIGALIARGDRVSVTSRDKDVTLRLLDHYGIEHVCLSRAPSTPWGLVLEMLGRGYRLQKWLKRVKPDVVLAREGVFAAQAGWWAGYPSISFDDTDDARLQLASYTGFVTRIYTDHSYGRNFGRKHRFFRGAMALAYVSPGVFRPDPDIIRQFGLDPDTRIIFCRLVNWAASHDIGQKGMDRASLSEVLNELGRFGRVVLTSEAPLDAELEPYRIAVPPEQIHQLMAASSLYIGESATMAAECAILGVPSLHVSTRSLWYTRLLEAEGGMVRNIGHSQDVLKTALSILQDPQARSRHRLALERYVSASDDVVKTVLNAVDEFCP